MLWIRFKKKGFCKQRSACVLTLPVFFHRYFWLPLINFQGRMSDLRIPTLFYSVLQEPFHVALSIADGIHCGPFDEVAKTNRVCDGSLLEPHSQQVVLCI